MRRMRAAVCWGLGMFLTCSCTGLADWPRFRGPNGSGIADDKLPVPVQWNASTNIKWSVELPGPGVSCPIVVGDKVLVTAYSGYGVERDTSTSIDALTRHLVCFDSSDGQVLWTQAVLSEAREDEYSGMGVPQHGYASHTPASDGTHVYAFFGKTGVVAFDLDGNQLWKKSLGTESDPRRWGSSSSPIVVDDVVVVPAGAESRALVGLDKSSGQELWRVEDERLGMVWGTPSVIKAGDAVQVVVGVPYELWGINPKTGNCDWYCTAMDTDQFSSSPVVVGEIAYAIEGRGGGSIAVRAGGEGDVSKSNVVWSGRDSSRFGSPVVYEDRIYYFSSNVCYCTDAKTGKEIFRGRLRNSGSTQVDDANAESPDNSAGGRGGFGGGAGFGGGRGGGGMGNQDYASPVVADGKIYYLTGAGDVYVIEAGPEFRQLAVNHLGSLEERFAATPAISQGALYIRSNKRLYCIAN